LNDYWNCVNALSGGCFIPTLASHKADKYSIPRVSFDNNYQNILTKAVLETDFGFFQNPLPKKIIIYNPLRLNHFLVKELYFYKPFRTFFTFSSVQYSHVYFHRVYTLTVEDSIQFSLKLVNSLIKPSSLFSDL